MNVEAAGVDEVAEVAGRLRTAVEGVIEGKREVVDTLLVVLLAEGHLLLEDVPGVGKTMLAKALGRAVDVDVNRIQFTPDLMPSDVTGVSVWNQGSHRFEFSPGAIFASIVLGDEINRASPKTQAALLEAMEEGQVSTDGVTRPLPRPFMVIATQNPVEMEGTYALPEAQRDRFMALVQMGYPAQDAEVRMLDTHGGANPLEALEPVTDGATIQRCIAGVRNVHVQESLRHYLVRVVAATRGAAELRLGASPRASLHLLRAARAHAAVDGRDYVNPDDIRDLAPLVLAHRVLPSTSATLGGLQTAEVVRGLVASVPVPGER